MVQPLATTASLLLPLARFIFSEIVLGNSCTFLEVLNYCFIPKTAKDIPYRLDIYELLNRKSSLIVRVAAASGVAHEFLIIIPPKVKIKNGTSSFYSSIYATVRFKSMNPRYNICMY